MSKGKLLNKMRPETNVNLYRDELGILAIRAASTTTIKEDEKIGNSIEESLGKIRGRKRMLGIRRFGHLLESLVLPFILMSDGTYRLSQSLPTGDLPNIGIGVAEFYLGLRLLRSESTELDIQESRTKAILRELAKGEVKIVDTAEENTDRIDS